MLAVVVLAGVGFLLYRRARDKRDKRYEDEENR